MATTSQDPQIARLQAAIIDGRTANIRYRQNEFLKLHSTLTDNIDAISVAITKDTQGPEGEVEAEIFLTLDVLRSHYDALDFKKELKEEYAITKGEDNEGRRVGVGIVFVKPTSHTRFYSVLAPVLAAVAAGNCILLELEYTTLNVDALLKNLLPKALDQDTFAISNTRTKESELEPYFLVDQTQSSPTPLIPKSNQILSNLQSRTLAIVDRTANIDAAAKAIVTARFSFQGTSSYAPDLVIINEFVKKEFFEAATKYASLIFSERKLGKGPIGPARILNDETRKAIKEAEAKNQVTSFGSHDFKLLDISDRKSPLTSLKISGYYLPIVSSNSIIDAVFNVSSKTTYLAGYFFGSPSTAKFCSQHIDSALSYANQIPAHLLIGPSSPISHTPTPHPRYSSALFSIPRPQYITPPPASVAPITQLLDSNSSGDKVKRQEVRKLAQAKLKETGQGQGKAIGFFEQGIIAGASIFFGIVVPATLYGSWVLGRKGLEVWRSRR